jgi:hypothetical protein
VAPILEIIKNSLWRCEHHDEGVMVLSKRGAILEGPQGHAPKDIEMFSEEYETVAYCSSCDVTFTYKEVSILGGRDPVPLFCPICRKDLDCMVESDAQLMKQEPGKQTEEEW